ncbi:MAG: DUF11 domain-containing protein, partial [Gemmataceae bacterium]|nr:DUF11 domain-containing protein [Gemmataceae bacterium]MDW8263692.1 DUF11 domain-containing protein [Gemmataceae bacterium]
MKRSVAYAGLMLVLALIGGFGLVLGQVQPVLLKPTTDDSPPRPLPTEVGRVAATPAVQIDKTGPHVINVGETLVYEIAVRNVGTVAVGEVRVVDEVPAGARFLGAEPPPEGGAGPRLSWSLGTLAPGVEQRIKVRLQAVQPIELRATATVTFSASAAVATRITEPRLRLVKTGPESVQVGEPAVFQLTITNTGTGPAHHVILRDHLPPGLRHPQGELVETDVGTLHPGEARTITLTTTAVHAGRFVNQATVTAEGGV